MVDPKNALLGAIMGGTLPVAIPAGLAVGRGVGDLASSLTAPANARGGADLIKALDLATPAEANAIAAQLRAAPTLVPGSPPTLAQALQNPQASILERVVGASAGATKLQNHYPMQQQAWRDALEGVAPTDPLKSANAKNDLGIAIGRRATQDEAMSTKAIDALYQDAHRKGAGDVIPLPIGDMEAAVDRYLGPLTFGKNADAAAALSTVQRGAAPIGGSPASTILGANGQPMVAAVAPTGVGAPFSEATKLKNSISEAWAKASEQGDNQTAAALAAQLHAVDDAIRQNLSGPALADWVAANAGHAEKMDRFHTGPQAALFQTRNGAPLKEGGEITNQFWGQRPGLQQDVESFRRLVGDDPSMMNQFRSMVTTEGADTIGAGGTKMGDKFARWVSTHRPGLDVAFSPADVQMLDRIGQDINRQSAATAAGHGPMQRSDTYANAQNALSLGLLDNPILEKLAGHLPMGVGKVLGPAVGWAQSGIATYARNAKANRLAELLTDTPAAADAIEAAIARQASPNALSRLLESQLVSRQLPGVAMRAVPGLASIGK
jgi:hypothetical protein